MPHKVIDVLEIIKVKKDHGKHFVLLCVLDQSVDDFFEKHPVRKTGKGIIVSHSEELIFISDLIEHAGEAVGYQLKGVVESFIPEIGSGRSHAHDPKNPSRLFQGRNHDGHSVFVHLGFKGIQFPDEFTFRKTAPRKMLHELIDMLREEPVVFDPDQVVSSVSFDLLDLLVLTREDVDAAVVSIHVFYAFFQKHIQIAAEVLVPCHGEDHGHFRDEPLMIDLSFKLF